MRFNDVGNALLDWQPAAITYLKWIARPDNAHCIATAGF